MYIKNNIIIGKDTFRYDSNGLAQFQATCDYAQVKDRSDKYYLFKQISHYKNEPDIILFTPFTLDYFNSGDHAQFIIARKRNVWQWNEHMLAPDKLRALRLPEDNGDADIKRVLGYDSMTEGDSLRFFNHLVQCESNLPAEFWPVLMLWLIDETNHYNGFTNVMTYLFGEDVDESERLQNEPSDFEQFKFLLEDGFKLLIALAYDEAATITAYTNDMRLYSAIGSDMTRFVKNVIRDESWHFSKFANMAAKYYGGRYDEIDGILEEISSLDGKEYKRTFFFDHDPSHEEQFTDVMRLSAAQIAKRGLMKAKQRKFSLASHI